MRTLWLRAQIYLVISIVAPGESILTEYVPECAKSGVNMGASVGALAGGASTAAALTTTGIGGVSLATCPSLAMTSVIGTGGILGGPMATLGGFLAGMLMGGLAGAGTNGWVHCRRKEINQAKRAAQFYIQNHPEGEQLKVLQQSYDQFFQPQSKFLTTKGPLYYNFKPQPVYRPPPSYIRPARPHYASQPHYPAQPAQEVRPIQSGVTISAPSSHSDSMLMSAVKPNEAQNVVDFRQELLEVVKLTLKDVINDDIPDQKTRKAKQSRWKWSDASDTETAGDDMDDIDEVMLQDLSELHHFKPPSGLPHLGGFSPKPRPRKQIFRASQQHGPGSSLDEALGRRPFTQARIAPFYQNEGLKLKGEREQQKSPNLFSYLRSLPQPQRYLEVKIPPSDNNANAESLVQTY